MRKHKADEELDQCQLRVDSLEEAESKLQRELKELQAALQKAQQGEQQHDADVQLEERKLHGQIEELEESESKLKREIRQLQATLQKVVSAKRRNAVNR